MATCRRRPYKKNNIYIFGLSTSLLKLMVNSMIWFDLFFNTPFFHHHFTNAKMYSGGLGEKPLHLEKEFNVIYF